MSDFLRTVTPLDLGAVEVALAERDAALRTLHAVLRMFPEMSTGMSTAQQQQTLRDARALLAMYEFAPTNGVKP